MSRAFFCKLVSKGAVAVYANILLVKTNAAMKEKQVILFKNEKARDDESAFQPVLVLMQGKALEILTRHHYKLPSVFDKGQQAFFDLCLG